MAISSNPPGITNLANQGLLVGEQSVAKQTEIPEGRVKAEAIKEISPVVKTYAPELSAIDIKLMEDMDFDYPDDIDYNARRVLTDEENSKIAAKDVAHAFRSENGEVKTYSVASKALNSDLNTQARTLYSHPKEFLSFVAKNTNPSWLAFSWENFCNQILTAIKEAVEEFSFEPFSKIVFSQNCVHCARAVDQTLSQFIQKNRPAEDFNSSAKLIQVDVGHQGGAWLIQGGTSEIRLPIEGGNYLQNLGEKIKPGERACIMVPVTMAKGSFSHAMNLVNVGPGPGETEDRIFAVCGQSGRVFDLADKKDMENFYARHTYTGLVDPGLCQNADVSYIIMDDSRRNRIQEMRAYA